jgi:hypothetical protein
MLNLDRALTVTANALSIFVASSVTIGTTSPAGKSSLAP